MDFKFFTLISILTGCSAPNSAQVYKGVVGTPLDTASPVFQVYDQASEKFFFLDKPSGQILGVQMSDLSIQDRLSGLPGENQTVLSHYQGNYLVHFSKQNLEVIGEDGRRSENPFPFQGQPVSAAFQPETGYLVMQDSLKSLGVMKISDLGDIENSWLGGSLFAKDKNLISGDINSEGKLVVAASDESFIVANLDETMTQQKWIYSSFQVDLGQVSWVAPIPDFPQLFLVTSSDFIAIVDIDLEKTIDYVGIKNQKILYQSKLGQPHVVVEINETRHFFYYDGSLKNHELPLSEYQKPASSLLVDGTLKMLFSTAKTQSILSLRLADNLVVTQKDYQISGKVYLAKDFIMVDTQAPLGYLKRLNFEAGTEIINQGFNIDFFIP